ncbi:hypothetical protein COT75_04875 [Candidatus Beckwithbacteria bacterium CG10_big_fil_rev_8_21_14_0_10_34_10]|uniref:Cohesin domain-containing protein n=1 Tax=Candidatus Beckwithbacteria bacterium CG10_big_fil_rev_8_21_14_0_10_34_10 TaxID=1974495 RepID=A0A2H0W829_9BACT|nr:MAG: hypothetical protein COT75_04875 [Candidatus Beckwithbacteria bacterium CG10_big_fil_rev_8_21_14_0_10_34_10]
MKKYVPLVSIFLMLGLALFGYFIFRQWTEKEISRLDKEIETITKEVEPSPREFDLGEIKAENNLTLFLKTNKKSYDQGETFELQVLVDGQGEEVDGVEFVLGFDSKIIEIKEIKENSYFKLYPQKKIDLDKEEVRVIALQDVNKNEKLNQEIVVSLSVMAKEKGSAEFIFDEDKTHIAGYGGQDLLKEAAPLTIKIN